MLSVAYQHYMYQGFLLWGSILLVQEIILILLDYKIFNYFLFCFFVFIFLSYFSRCLANEKDEVSLRTGKSISSHLPKTSVLSAKPQGQGQL